MYVFQSLLLNINNKWTKMFIFQKKVLTLYRKQKLEKQKPEVS